MPLCSLILHNRELYLTSMLYCQAPGEGHAYYSFFAFLIYTVSTSVIIGWLYNASGKKLIIAWIIHAVGNVAVPFFPILHMAEVAQPGYWVWVSVSALVAIYLTIWYMRKTERDLSTSL